MNVQQATLVLMEYALTLSGVLNVNALPVTDWMQTRSLVMVGNQLQIFRFFFFRLLCQKTVCSNLNSFLYKFFKFFDNPSCKLAL